ncbi:MAG: MBL fold metallo-hydrolase [Hyphomicrobium sp.]|nr:MBL fold metallo-hydrolase [Hyphomicrobium sp.]
MAVRYGEPDPVMPGVVRLVANNPGPFTFKGTNTYLVGMTELAVIDPGPDDAAHRQHILDIAGGRPITHILLTHAHRDHTDGARPLASMTGAPILAYGRSRDAERVKAGHEPQGKAFVDYDLEPDVRLFHGDIIQSAEFQIEALHTPGHAPDHLCFALEAGRVLFSGDHVMSWNTTVIAPPEGRMSDYIRSLELLQPRRDRVYLPGHGGRIDQPQRVVKAYLVHRQWRETAVLEAIRGGATTIPEVVAKVYAGIDPKLITAAGLSVLAHVETLVERRLVTCEEPLSLDRRFSAL